MRLAPSTRRRRGRARVCSDSTMWAISWRVSRRAARDLADADGAPTRETHYLAHGCSHRSDTHPRRAGVGNRCSWTDGLHNRVVWVLLLRDREQALKTSPVCAEGYVSALKFFGLPSKSSSLVPRLSIAPT